MQKCSRHSARLSCSGAAVLIVALGFAPVALAQSAADKATARQAATEGIELYDDGEYAEALDRLKRAQALYDAPVHLLYIARSQRELGQLVEAAENYRLLVRYQLQDGAPRAFTEAVKSGKKELAELEPRVPSLLISVEPKDVEGAELEIDGRKVAAAVIGIRRPINPGSHELVLDAPGYKPTRQTVEVEEGAKSEVTLRLEAAPEEAKPAAAPGEAGEEKQKKTQTDAGDDRGLVGFLVGVRLGLGIPFGAAATNVGTAGTEIRMSDVFGPGGGAELRAGLRIAGYFTPFLYGDGFALSASEDLGREVFPTADVNASGATARSAGAGLMVGTEPGRFGGYGEVAFGVTEEYELDIQGPAGNCKLNARLRGNTFRIGGGVTIPIVRFFELKPFASVALGRFQDLDAEYTGGLACPTGRIPEGETVLDDNQQATHGLFVIGVGGDFIFGKDLPDE